MSFMVRMDLGSDSLDATSLQLSTDTAASHTSRQCVSRGRAERRANSRAPSAARSWVLEVVGRQEEQAGSWVPNSVR